MLDHEGQLKAYSEHLRANKGDKAAAYKSISEIITAAVDNEESPEKLDTLEAIKRFLEVAIIKNYMERHGYKQQYNCNLSAWEWVRD